MADPIASPDPGAGFIDMPNPAATEPGIEADVEVVLCCKRKNGISLLVDGQPVSAEFEVSKKGTLCRTRRSIICTNCGAYLCDPELRRLPYKRGDDIAIDENIDAMLGTKKESKS